jgi:WD40 repeat protein
MLHGLFSLPPPRPSKFAPDGKKKLNYFALPHGYQKQSQQELFVSGGEDGTLIYWLVGHEGPQAEDKRSTHDAVVSAVCWHPLGHMLASASK